MLAAIMTMALPTASVVALGFWARWLRRRATAPRWATSIAYGFAGLATLLIAGGGARGAWEMLGAKGSAPGEKARALTEAISAAMYLGALGLLVAVVGAVWLAFSTWRWRVRRRPAGRA
jgi:hypothetical protein